MNSQLRQLENKSIFLLREAYANFKNLGVLWSIGKDSTVLLWLIRKAFAGHVPIPLIHIDTSFKIPEMIRYRDQLAKDWGLKLIVSSNTEALEKKETFPDGKLSRMQCCQSLKTQALTNVIQREKIDGIIAGIRSDEEGSRSKERYFSPRTLDNDWNIIEQPPEFWNQFNTDFKPGTHVRIHPLLDWTETNIWEYILQEKIPTVSLYYDQGNGSRYRSLGCYPCTQPVSSTAKNPAEIIAELKTGKFSRVAERSGRSQDSEDGGGLESLRTKGYM